MGGNAVRAAAETYIGLVEFGAGVIPAGGGCARLYRRNLAMLLDPQDLQPAFRKTFETIGTAKVATSAEEARQLGFLRPGDSWSMNRGHLAADARDLALALAENDFVPPVPDPAIPVMGTAGIAPGRVGALQHAGGRLHQRARPQDRPHARQRAVRRRRCPRARRSATSDILDLERESFMRLMGERKTLERMEHILKTGKPLRN